MEEKVVWVKNFADRKNKEQGVIKMNSSWVAKCLSIEKSLNIYGVGNRFLLYTYTKNPTLIDDGIFFFFFKKQKQKKKIIIPNYYKIKNTTFFF